MDRLAFKEEFGLSRLPAYLKYKVDFARENPFFFNDIGTMIFSGPQGSGKTLSAVNYVYNLLEMYPRMVLCTNVSITDYPFNVGYRVVDGKAEYYRLDDLSPVSLGKYKEGLHDIHNGNIDYVCIEYDGLDCLKYINNNDLGVVFLIDELHLELNSLESKNIDIDVMVEISQQRKQRKKIIGTSQVFMRLAKPIREQIFDVVICNNFFKCIQFNKAIDGETAVEENGKLKATVKKRSLYFHDPEMYKRYDTYAKMRRYNKEWQGHRRDPVVSSAVMLSAKKMKGVSVK